MLCKIVKIPRIAGKAASLIANMETVAPGINPIPPVKITLTKPNVDKKFFFLR